MKKISDAVAEIIDVNPDLRTGLGQGLMNLSQLARHILPLVEARTNKTVRPSAVAMALSRLQKELGRGEGMGFAGMAERVTVQRGLAVLTYGNTIAAQAALPRLQEQIRQRDGFLTVTEGMREITLLVEEDHLELVGSIMKVEALGEVRGVAGLSISLTRENLRTPGVLYRLLQPLALQGINVAEVASTTREFHVYIRERDVMLALDSLFAAYGRR